MSRAFVASGCPLVVQLKSFMAAVFNIHPQLDAQIPTHTWEHQQLSRGTLSELPRAQAVPSCPSLQLPTASFNAGFHRGIKTKQFLCVRGLDFQ